MELFNIDELLNRIDSKFSLCILLAKRARELGFYFTARKKGERVNIIPPLVENTVDDPLEVAIQELKEGKVSFIRVNDSIK
ncbi:MAG: DNA-directed RNA polymerase subunit omega [Actinobacteria bacterium]|nr:DNA-directed RNA polymerase subunit omega [Actinomycetota bacterium]